MSVDLEEVITDAVSDAALPTEEPEVSEDSSLEASSDESSAQDTSDTGEEVESSSQEVGSPATRQEVAKSEPDEFEKKFGIPAQGVSGRENRIPHSRVQKIVGKAEKAIHDTYLPQLKERDDKIAYYEAKDQKVTAFEEVMVNDPAKFIQTLYQNLPQYQEYLAPLFSPRPVQQEQAASEQVDGMPGPDLENPDGSLVYSEGGLKNLIEWAITQGETRAVQTLESRYAPIEQSFQAHQVIQEASRKVTSEINEARTWPQFNENEAEIVKALQQDQRLSLEGAYRKVVWPKMTSDRNKMREELLQELKKAPSSTSTPNRAAARPAPSTGGNRSIEDVIREQVATLR